MRKSFALAATGVAAALVLASCAAGPEDDGADGVVDGATGEDVGFTACLVSDDGGFDDRSANQSGAEGLDRAAADLGIATIKVESTAESDYVTNIANLLAQDCDLVIGGGGTLEDAIQDAAEANPDVDFALVDSAFSDEGSNPVHLPNAKPLLFTTQEAAFLAGYVAAGSSRTGAVATFGGVPIPSVTIVMDGFVDGVARYNEDTDSSVTVLGWDKATQTGSFTGDSTTGTTGQDLAQGFLDQGADVVMPVTDPAGQGAAAALQASGGMLIGVGVDWFEASPEYSSIVLTSVLKEIGQAVYETVSDAARGEFDPTPYVGTLENAGVGLAPFHDLESMVPADVVTRVEELREAIVVGDLVVESVSAPPVAEGIPDAT